MRFVVFVKANEDTEAGMMPARRCSRRWASSTRSW